LTTAEVVNPLKFAVVVYPPLVTEPAIVEICYSQH